MLYKSYRPLHGIFSFLVSLRVAWRGFVYKMEATNNGNNFRLSRYYCDCTKVLGFSRWETVSHPTRYLQRNFVVAACGPVAYTQPGREGSEGLLTRAAPVLCLQHRDSREPFVTQCLRHCN
jgi:hypothetical protein